MLIRSQDKLSIVPHDIGIILIIGTEVRIISMNNENMSGTLGKYSSEEKAIKVLDMIGEYYINTNNSRCLVFQMPQDNNITIK